MSGTKVMRPLWRRSLGVVNAELGEALGQLYVKKHFPPAARKAMDKLVDDLFDVYERRIKELDWMTPQTKKKAIVKLRAMGRKIGYPSKWKTYGGLVVKPNDLVGNIFRGNAFWHAREMRKLAKRKVDRTEWHMSPQTVNAYCSFEMNEIVFPAAILQPPFFDLSGDSSINYGAIGSVIGHEMTHAFDDQGSKFDAKGNRKTWWTPKDRKKFEKKAKVVVNQFNQYKVAPDLHVNGELTQGENIADLGGLSIAYDALMESLKRTGRKDISGLTPEQRFFLGWALFERENTRPEFLKMIVITDPHSPSQFRINGPISNSPEFYTAFGVKKGDKLYRDPKQRAKIW